MDERRRGGLGGVLVEAIIPTSWTCASGSHASHVFLVAGGVLAIPLPRARAAPATPRAWPRPGGEATALTCPPYPPSPVAC